MRTLFKKMRTVFKKMRTLALVRILVPGPPPDEIFYTISFEPKTISEETIKSLDEKSS